MWLLSGNVAWKGETRLTEEEAVARLQELAESQDTESAHFEADKVVCQVLLALGYTKIVEAYRAIDRYYG